MSSRPGQTTRQRLSSLRRSFKELSADALLVTNMSSVRYLSGFSGTEALLLITARTQKLITDSRYTEQAAKQARGFTVVRYNRRPGELAKIINGHKIKRLAFEPAGMTHARFLELSRALSGIKLAGLSGAVEKLREVKTEKEIELIAEAARLAYQAFKDTAPKLRPGVTEAGHAALLEYRMRQLGSGPAPFDTIVASGARGALPHGVASGKKIKKGEMVTIDFGAIYQGYQSDQTITVCLGKPAARQRKVYDTVRKAHDLAIQAIRPGARCKDVDKVARDHIQEAGFGKYFGHGLGHGVGLDTHEGPTLSPLSKGVLEPGMVVTVEPGVYIPGWGGVRIEDMALVTDGGCRLLTWSGGDLREI